MKKAVQKDLKKYLERLGIFTDNKTHCNLNAKTYLKKVKKVKKVSCGGMYSTVFNLLGFKAKAKDSRTLKKFKIRELNENCLIRVLRMGGLSERLLNQLKMTYRNRYIPRCKLKLIAESGGFCIHLRKSTAATSDKHISHYGSRNFQDHYHISLVDDHYFIDEPTTCTAFAINRVHQQKIKTQQACS